MNKMKERSPENEYNIYPRLKLTFSSPFNCLSTVNKLCEYFKSFSLMFLDYINYDDKGLSYGIWKKNKGEFIWRFEILNNISDRTVCQWSHYCEIWTWLTSRDKTSRKHPIYNCLFYIATFDGFSSYKDTSSLRVCILVTGDDLRDSFDPLTLKQACLVRAYNVVY